MPSLWDYVHLGRNHHHSHNDSSSSHNQYNNEYHNLQEGLMQIASQTCRILVQVNNTNNITFNQNIINRYGSGSGGGGDLDNSDSLAASDMNSYPIASTSRSMTNEQSVVLLSPSITTTTTTTAKFNRRLSRAEGAKKFLKDYKHRLSTVLEGNPPPGEDDFELWDQSQMWRSEHKKWQHNTWCKPSCIPITVIFFLIVLVVLLPLVEQANDKILHTKHNGSSYVCTDRCNIQLVESIPVGLNYSDDSPKFLSTFDAWMKLFKLANSTINIGSFYWTLRGADFYNHSTAWQGEKIFQQFLTAGTQRNLKIRIAQSAPTQENPNFDTEFLERRNAIELRSVNFPRLVGGGVLHTKVWIIDEQHFYIGSANMDWRSLTQVKELGVLVTNCTCLAKDINKIFNAYWYLGKNNSHVPAYWPDDYSTKFNLNNMLKVNFNQAFDFKVFFSSSPPPLSPRGRTQDLDAIVNTILHAEKFVYIAVMDYFPLTIYTPKHKFWPYIDNAIRTAAIENKVAVKMLISYWKHSRPEEDHYLRSLESLADPTANIDIQIKRFIVRSDADQDKIPFARVNHNKYMVTDNTAYIGTSNWSGDYFTDTAGIGLILRETDYDRLHNETTLRSQLESVFIRDWDSEYSVDLATINVH